MKNFCHCFGFVKAIPLVPAHVLQPFTETISSPRKAMMSSLSSTPEAPYAHPDSPLPKLPVVVMGR
jgi:hypothetical protein